MVRRDAPVTWHPTAWSAHEPWPYDAKDLLIVGPPGTGKTHTLLTRYAWPLIRVGQSVLVVSFTRAAARVLRERTAAELGGTPDDYRRTFSTIHSEAWWRLGGGRGADDDPDDEDVPEALWRRVYQSDRDDVDRAWGLTRALYPQDRDLPVRDRLAKVVPGHRLDHVTAVVEARRKNLAAALDYTDVLEAALVGGRRRPLALLAIDEANDCTSLQRALIARWAADADRFLAVGDPDQTVYRWAGADPGYLTRRIVAGRDDPVTKPVRRLQLSHRVPLASHVWARSIIAQVRDRVDAPYEHSGRSGSLASATPSVAVAEALAVARSGEPVLMLSRTRAGCQRIVAELDAANVPNTPERGRGLWSAVARSAAFFGSGGADHAPPPPKAVQAILARLVARQGLDAPEIARRLVVTTIHGAKGREAALVVLDARSGSGHAGIGSPGHADDERRLAYVAATRSWDRTLVIPPKARGWLDRVGARRALHTHMSRRQTTTID